MEKERGQQRGGEGIGEPGEPRGYLDAVPANASKEEAVLRRLAAYAEGEIVVKTGIDLQQRVAHLDHHGGQAAEVVEIVGLRG